MVAYLTKNWRNKKTIESWMHQTCHIKTFGTSQNQLKMLIIWVSILISLKYQMQWHLSPFLFGGSVSVSTFDVYGMECNQRWSHRFICRWNWVCFSFIFFLSCSTSMIDHLHKRRISKNKKWKWKKKTMNQHRQ